MNIPPMLKKVWNVASTVIVILAVLIAVFLMGSRLIGFGVYSISNDGLAPQYNKGDLIYVQTVDPVKVQNGDVLTFVSDEKLNVDTKTVVEIDASCEHFYTEATINGEKTPTVVYFKNIIGTPIFKIPLLGYVFDFVQNPPGVYIAIAVGILLIAAIILPDFLAKRKKNEEEKTEESDKTENAETEDSEAENDTSEDTIGEKE